MNVKKPYRIHSTKIETIETLARLIAIQTDLTARADDDDDKGSVDPLTGLPPPNSPLPSSNGDLLGGLLGWLSGLKGVAGS